MKNAYFIDANTDLQINAVFINVNFVTDLSKLFASATWFAVFLHTADTDQALTNVTQSTETLWISDIESQNASSTNIINYLSESQSSVSAVIL